MRRRRVQRREREKMGAEKRKGETGRDEGPRGEECRDDREREKMRGVQIGIFWVNFWRRENWTRSPFRTALKKHLPGAFL